MRRRIRSFSGNDPSAARVTAYVEPPRMLETAMRRYGRLAREHGRDRVAGDGLAAADRVEPFVALGLQADARLGQMEKRRQRRLQLLVMRLELGLLGDQGGVQVYQFAAAGGELLQGVGHDLLRFETLVLFV